MCHPPAPELTPWRPPIANRTDAHGYRTDKLASGPAKNPHNPMFSDPPTPRSARIYKGFTDKKCKIAQIYRDPHACTDKTYYMLPPECDRPRSQQRPNSDQAANRS